MKTDPREHSSDDASRPAPRDLRTYLLEMLNSPAGTSLLELRRNWHDRDNEHGSDGGCDSVGWSAAVRQEAEDPRQSPAQTRQRDREELEFVWERAAQGDLSELLTRLAALDDSPWQETRRAAARARAVLRARTAIEEAFPKAWKPWHRELVFGLLVRPWSESSQHRANLRLRPAHEFRPLWRSRRFLELLPGMLRDVDDAQQVSAFCLKLAIPETQNPSAQREGVIRGCARRLPPGSWSRTCLDILGDDLPQGFDIALTGLGMVSLVFLVLFVIYARTAGRTNGFQAALGAGPRPGQPVETLFPLGPSPQAPSVPGPLSPSLTSQSLPDEWLQSDVSSIGSELALIKNDIEVMLAFDPQIPDSRADSWRRRLDGIEDRIADRRQRGAAGAESDPQLAALQQECAGLRETLDQRRAATQPRPSSGDVFLEKARKTISSVEKELGAPPSFEDKRTDPLTPGQSGKRNPGRPLGFEELLNNDRPRIGGGLLEENESYRQFKRGRYGDPNNPIGPPVRPGTRRPGLGIPKGPTEPNPTPKDQGSRKSSRHFRPERLGQPPLGSTRPHLASRLHDLSVAEVLKDLTQFTEPVPRPSSHRVAVAAATEASRPLCEASFGCLLANVTPRGTAILGGPR